MSLTGVKTRPKLAGTLAVAGPWQTLFARAGYRIYPYQMGAMVRSTSTGTTVSTYGLGDFVANNYVIICSATSYGNGTLFIPDTSRIRRISSVSVSDDQITLGTSVSVTAGEFILNIGNDGASSPLVSPNYDGSTVNLFTDNAGVTANSNKYLVSGSGGTFQGWTQAGKTVIDLLISDSSGNPVLVWPFFTLGTAA